MSRPSPHPPRSFIPAVDGPLLATAVIWGLNYVGVKRAFQEVTPLAFNGVRFALASLMFLVTIAIARRASHRLPSAMAELVAVPERLSMRDRWDLLWVGLVGHCAYQWCWTAALARTSVSNGALIMSMTPIMVALLASVVGRERLGRMFWVGAAVSVVGVYFVAGRHPAEGGGSTLHGDLLMVVAAFAWAAYTIGSAGLIARYSVLYVTGMTMAIGSGINVLILMPTILSVPWTSVSAIVWWLLVPSALVAGYLAFVVWFAAMHVIGAARTTVYANVVPIAAMVSAAIWLGESITAARAVGALAVLGGVALTRVGPHQPAAAVTPRR